MAMEPLAHVHPYKWDKLHGDTFRILHVEVVEPQIRISLKVELIKQPPLYHAISYSWEGAVPSIQIQCNGREMLVTETIAEALRCIPTSTGDSVLWVDSVCINQDDPFEKADQVSKMSKIFGQAADVIVWLGPAADGSDEAMDAIQRIKNDFPADETFSWLSTPKISQKHLSLLPMSLIVPLKKLSERSWFQRLWVVQEVVLAKSFRWLCGLKVIEQDVFTRVTGGLSAGVFFQDRIDQNEFTGDMSPAEFRAFPTMDRVMWIRTAISQIGISGFLDLVNDLREKEVTEPVDRVYALLSLAQDDESFFSDNIIIDYSRKTKEEYWRVYAQVGKLALHLHPTLELLNYTSSRYRPIGLPSWCPNFNSIQLTSVRKHSHTAGMLPMDHAELFKQKLDLKSNSCSEAHPRQEGKYEPGSLIKVSQGHDLIALTGAKIDKVSFVSVSCNWEIKWSLKDLGQIKSDVDTIVDWLSMNLQLYFVWQKERQLWPSLDATEVALRVQAAYRRFVNTLFEGDAPEPESGFSKNSPDFGKDFLETFHGLLRQEVERIQSELLNTETETSKESAAPTMNQVGEVSASWGDDPGDVIEPVERMLQEDEQDKSLPGIQNEEPNRQPQQQQAGKMLPTYEDNGIANIETEESQTAEGGASDTVESTVQAILVLYPWLSELQKIWQHRALIMTTEGRIGFASVEAQPGDQVCMFYQGPTMYVLRPARSINGNSTNLLVTVILMGT